MPYGLLGSSPLSSHTKLLHTLLMDSIQAKWPTYCTDPPVADIAFWDVEAPNQNDIEFSFELLPDIRDPGRRPLGWHLIPILGYVNIHVYVRGADVESMPPDMIKVVNALEHLIEKERKALIPFSEFVTIDRMMEIPRDDVNQKRWHWYCSVMIGYTKVIT